jgi:oxygen-dependent protoporphyrinogen oxidase
MDATFANLVELERMHGSLFVGLNGGKHPLQVMLEPVSATPSPFYSLRRGLGSLIAALRACLSLERVQLGQRVTGIQRGRDSGYVVRTSSVEIEASAVVLAGPPWSAATLLSNCLPDVSSTLAQIRGYSTATVYFALSTEHMAQELTGSGFIVPPGEGQILAASYVSCKWAGRAPLGKALVRAFVGGSRMDIVPLSHAQLKHIAHQELTRFLGPLGPVEFSVVHRYGRGNPQPELGHGHKLESIFTGLRRMPGLYLIGSGYGAVGIPDCIVQAQQTARHIVDSRAG